jgi:Asp-tRNA(Asn)/Glu-tRNA(Gln) amidotransferase C subunit
MSVDADTVRRIAQLARIAVAEDEVEHLRGELNAILAFVEQLSASPMTSSRTRRRRRTISSWYRRWWNKPRAAYSTILGRA